MSEAIADLFDLQEQLRADASGTARDNLLKAFDERAREIKRAMDVGVTPEEFRKLGTMHDGLAAAAEVVAMTWGRYHLKPAT